MLIYIALLLKIATDKTILDIIMKVVIPTATKHCSLLIVPANSSLELIKNVGTYSLNEGKKLSRCDRTYAAPAVSVTADADFEAVDASKTTEISHNPTR